VVTRVLFFRPSLADGGADRVTLTLLERLDRSRFAPMLALVKATGALLPQVPRDVPVIDLRAPRLAAAAPLLALAIRKHRPDVVFCTSGAANVVCVAAHAAARSSARLVLSERSALDRGERSRLRRAVELRMKRLAYPRADLVTAVSDGVARDLETTLGLAPSKIRVVYNPMVDDDLSARAGEAVAHPWFAGPDPVLVACGRLVEVKDYPTLFAAFARVRAVRPVRLVLLGDGPLRRPLESEVRAAGLADSVAFLGFDPNPLKYMAKAHALVQASRAEGLPGAIIQSMACGTPVVSTDCDFGPREVIRDGRDGFLVPVGDAAALAARTLQLVEDVPLRDRMSLRAKQGAQRFTVDATLRRYEDALTGAAP
jgi:glycosyltransferase involved in cell wall biosynthesis